MACGIYRELAQKTLGEFNEAGKPKTLAKYFVKFNDFAEPQRPHRRAYLRLLGRPYTLLYVKKSVGKTQNPML